MVLEEIIAWVIFGVITKLAIEHKTEIKVITQIKDNVKKTK